MTSILVTLALRALTRNGTFDGFSMLLKKERLISCIRRRSRLGK
jgi:hypothetical protein